MKKRILSILLCLVMVVGMLPISVFAESEVNECWHCGAIYYGDVDDDIYDSNCGGCGIGANADCWFEVHCWNCGACYVEVFSWCEDCTWCIDCINSNEETHCADCKKCFLSEEDELCPDCHRCDSCVYICPYCGYCEDCWADADDTMHCSLCGECYEVTGFPEHDAAQHCPYCCVTCDQCGDWETCTADDHEIEYCDECGLCMDCCMENRNAASGCDEYCIESVEFEEHYCEECGECWCGREACEICGLCEDCCAANSDCSDSMCVEDGDYEDHFCENCGACAHEFEEICFTCGYCDQCCLDARLIYGCDCDADKGVCMEDSDFEEHLATVHPEAEPGEHPCTPKAMWSIDENNHWKSCRFCDEEGHFTGKEAHKYNVDGKCVVCGYQQGRRVYFTRQPENAKAKVGDPNDYNGMGGDPGSTHPVKNSVTFRVSARGEGELTYEWWRLDPEAEDPYSSAISLAACEGNIDPVTAFIYEGANTNRLTVYVSEEGCNQDLSEYMQFFCMVYDDTGESYRQSAQSETVRLTVGHRYSRCSSQYIAGTNRPMYGPDETLVYRQIDSVWESDGHNWECCGKECYELKNLANTPHSYSLVGPVEGTFSNAEAGKGIFHTNYKYKCVFCGQRKYVEKHAHDFQAPGDPEQINQLLADGRYTNAVHPLVCTVDGCEEQRSEMHEWTFDVVAYPTATKPGALHRVCSICDYWIDGEWYAYNPTLGHGTETYWDRSNMIVEAIGGAANRTLLFPNESLTVTPTPEEGSAVIG